MQCVGRSRRPSRTPLDLAIFEQPEEPRQRRHSIDQGTLRFPRHPIPVAHSEPCSPTTSRIMASGGVRHRPGFLAIPPLPPVFLPLGAATTPPPVRARLLWGDSMRVSPDSKEAKELEKEFEEFFALADRRDSVGGESSSEATDDASEQFELSRSAQDSALAWWRDAASKHGQYAVGMDCPPSPTPSP